jgi:4-coumarate--CoA ligase
MRIFEHYRLNRVTIMISHYNRESKILSGSLIEPFFHPNVSAGQLALFSLQRDPSKVVQVSYDDGVQLTAGEMAKLSLRVAKNLLMEGLKMGDVIGLVVKNSNYVAPIVLGSLLIATPCNTLDPTFEKNEIAQIFMQTKPKIVFCDKDNWEVVVEALKDCGNISEVWTIDEKMTGELIIY